MVNELPLKMITSKTQHFSHSHFNWILSPKTENKTTKETVTYSCISFMEPRSEKLHSEIVRLFTVHFRLNPDLQLNTNLPFFS